MTPGEQLPTRVEVLDTARVLRYAGAATDFNPIHFDPEVAAAVSPTGTPIAHGMLTLGILAAHLTDWAGGPERLLALEATFKAPCPVGARVQLGGQVTAVDAAAGTATVAVWARLDDGAKVIDDRRSRAVVRLAGR